MTGIKGKRALGTHNLDELETFTGTPQAGDLRVIFDASDNQVKTRDATQTQENSLTQGDIFIGDALNVAIGQTMSGDATLNAVGALTLSVPKIRVAIRHTWAGGAATTDTVTLTGVAATDAIETTINANSGVGVVVSAERSGADAVLLTTSANMADGDIISVMAIQLS